MRTTTTYAAQILAVETARPYSCFKASAVEIRYKTELLIMKNNPRKKRRLNVGSELVRRLKAFNEVLETTDNMAKRFTCRTIRLQREPKEYSGADVKEVQDLLGVSPPEPHPAARR